VLRIADLHLPGVMPMDPHEPPPGRPPPSRWVPVRDRWPSSCGWPADPASSPGSVVRHVRGWAVADDRDHAHRCRSVIAVSEAVSNSIEHAYPGSHAETASGRGRLDTVEASRRCGPNTTRSARASLTTAPGNHPPEAHL